MIFIKPTTNSSRNYIIHNDTRVIAPSAFSGCNRLAEITIPNSVVGIGYKAFSGCSSLNNISLPWVCGRWDNIFDSAPDTIVITGGTTIGRNAFKECYDVKNIIIVDGIETIEEYAFYYCGSLESIVIGNCVKSIGFRSVYSCGAMKSISLPWIVSSLGYIFDFMFYEDYSKITEVIITDVNGTLYMGNPYNTVDIIKICTDKEIKISNEAFKDWKYLESIELPTNVTHIGNYAFLGCSSLTNINIPDNVISIGNSAFNGCSSLTNIVIPDSVTSIGYEAFYGCSSLTSIEIPDSVTSIGNSAFRNCSSLTSINFKGTVEQWNSISKEDFWNSSTYTYTIYCTDGQISKDGTVTYK